MIHSHKFDSNRLDARFRYRADHRLLTILEDAGLARSALTRAWIDAYSFGIPFIDALCGGGRIGERAIVEALAEHFGVEIAHPDYDRGAQGMPFALAIRAGAIRLADGAIALTPRGRDLSQLLETLDATYEGSSIRLVTRQDLIAIALHSNKAQVAYEATYGLQSEMPHFSAARLFNWQQMMVGMTLVFLTGFSAIACPLAIFTAAQTLGCIAFLALAWARLAACCVHFSPEKRALHIREHELPIYTILVPLFREQAALEGLLVALQNLDYPHMKLDVKLLIEDDDQLTQNALKSIDVPSWVDIVLIPKGEVRTKPRALNVGLSVARGHYLVVYDAEDRPASMQLRQALDRFETADRRTAVVQARLVIDRSQRGFLPDQFRLEYAGLFAVILPALAVFKLPIPLGGTSNHFRTEILREVGGWDAFNVTEDADIGLRLHRLGYRASVIASQTEEEAPVKIGAWLNQRTRWFKGWVVTILVHTRHPLALVRECGLFGSVVFLLLTGGIVLSALAEPICLALVMGSILRGDFLQYTDSLAEALLQSSFLISLIIGHLAAAVTYVRGALLLGLTPSLWSLTCIPVYWLLVSIAAWRGCWKALIEPHKWDKTAHTLTRIPRMRTSSETSRIDSDRDPVVLGRERYLSKRFAKR